MVGRGRAAGFCCLGKSVFAASHHLLPVGWSWGWGSGGPCGDPLGPGPRGLGPRYHGPRPLGPGPRQSQEGAEAPDVPVPGHPAHPGHGPHPLHPRPPTLVLQGLLLAGSPARHVALWWKGGVVHRTSTFFHLLLLPTPLPPSTLLTSHQLQSIASQGVQGEPVRLQLLPSPASCLWGGRRWRPCSSPPPTCSRQPAPPPPPGGGGGAPPSRPSLTTLARHMVPLAAPIPAPGQCT